MYSNEINKQQDVENTNFDVKQIENDIEELLRISGFQSDNGGQRAHEVLHRLYMAVSMFAKMDESEQAVIAATWNTAMRLASWAERSYQYENEAAKLRLERAKGKTASGGRAFGSSPAENTAEQKAIAAQREAADAKREAEMEEARKNSISFEEYAKTHPNSPLAKISVKK